jgi:hypothetical protein
VYGVSEEAEVIVDVGRCVVMSFSEDVSWAVLALTE